MEREQDLQGAVLIVEDNYALRTTLAAVLEEHYPVATASNGATALRLLHGPTKPALILLDLMMPILSGWEVMHRLQQDSTLAQIPVIVLSAIADDPTREHVSPVAAVVGKPVRLDTLLAVVAQVYPNRANGQHGGATHGG